MSDNGVKKRICIGIPCFQSMPPETEDDYMRMMYYLGRRYGEYDFFLAVKRKSEQFRARNAIVESAMQTGCDYLWMIDDDHVFDWKDKRHLDPDEPVVAYESLRLLMHHMQNAPKCGIVGALYYKRGGECGPVLLKESDKGGFFFLRDDEITGGLQEVAVTGGGCMLIDMSIFDKISPPWFDTEHSMGTDLQICTKARAEGFKIYCDTSIVIGHVQATRQVITPENRFHVATEFANKGFQDLKNEGMNHRMQTEQALGLYRLDAEEYLGVSFENMAVLALEYEKKYRNFHQFGNPDEYYKQLGPEQLGRQVWFHHSPMMVQEMDSILKSFRYDHEFYGMAFGCGSAPVDFELAMRGHRIDFVDLDGTPAYEFTKWRVKKRGLLKCGFEWKGPYDFITFFDSLEHIKDWRPLMQRAVESLKSEGFIVMNFFRNQDYNNVEHVNMDKEGVKNFLVEHGVYPLNDYIWMKHEFKEAAA